MRSTAFFRGSPLSRFQGITAKVMIHLDRGFRYVTVKRRFTVIYLPHSDRIEVVRIVDASRDLAAVLREL